MMSLIIIIEPALIEMTVGHQLKQQSQHDRVDQRVPITEGRYGPN